ncbi:hypothetical protein [Delftia acidovorans]|jgi:hypothetical protein|uniref:hypothetical protein n=1 Tax=Delftia acidovorans TaxID=80866 RepID=UPI00284DD32E|nr:hypothetical protein [Delftia acidovorans]
MSFDPITNAGVKALQGQVNTVQAQTTALTTKLAQIESALANLGAAQAASRKPLRVTEYTSGSGTHTFLPESTHQYVTLIGAGGAGAVGYSYSNTIARSGTGGAAGDELYRRLSYTGSINYQVGAGSTTRGGNTRLGFLEVAGGNMGDTGSFETGAGLPMQSVQRGHGITPGSVGDGTYAGSSSLGQGGKRGDNFTNATYPSGYGAGGGGSFTGRPATPGAGGYIRIEEY